MTAVRFEASIRYALWFVGYLTAVTILGAGAVGLGLGLGWPAVLGWSWLAATLGSTTGGLAYAVVGGVLIGLGVLIMAIGYVSGVYKLVADTIAAGTAELEQAVTDRPSPDVPVETPTAPSAEAAEPAAVDAATDQPDAAGIDPDPAPTEPDPTADVKPSGQLGTDRGPPDSPAPETEAGAPDSQPESDEEPPEPSPEEIAFGSSAPTADPAEEPVDDESAVEESADEDLSPAAQGAPSDPLVDPTDE